VSNETYSYGKRDLLHTQKRPTDILAPEPLSFMRQMRPLDVCASLALNLNTFSELNILRLQRGKARVHDLLAPVLKRQCPSIFTIESYCMPTFQNVCLLSLLLLL
jgi:hypothetical protein